MVSNTLRTNATCNLLPLYLSAIQEHCVRFRFTLRIILKYYGRCTNCETWNFVFFCFLFFRGRKIYLFADRLLLCAFINVIVIIIFIFIIININDNHNQDQR